MIGNVPLRDFSLPLLFRGWEMKFLSQTNVTKADVSEHLMVAINNHPVINLWKDYIQTVVHKCTVIATVMWFICYTSRQWLKEKKEIESNIARKLHSDGNECRSLLVCIVAAFIPNVFFFFQFFVYFFYLAVLTVVYLSCAAWVITHHCRNQGQEQVPTEATTPIELSPVEKDPSEKSPLSNGTNVRTWKGSEFYSLHGEVLSLGIVWFPSLMRFLWVTVHYWHIT